MGYRSVYSGRGAGRSDKADELFAGSNRRPLRIDLSGARLQGLVGLPQARVFSIEVGEVLRGDAALQWLIRPPGGAA